ncbi:MAG: glycosyltransferase family 25 protein [Alphaproteobacteria bacterium]|nr:glycosyltransferase family 25 protein [Alphaproteobacteria bacterium]
MTSFPPVFVISLSGALDRREKIKSRLDAQNIPFIFFDAVDGRSFDVPSLPFYDGTRRRAFFGRDMTGGEIGCLLSHKQIAQKMINEEIPFAVVLEDDAVLQPEFKEVVLSLMVTSYPWELVRFLGSNKVSKLRQRTVAHLTPTHRLTRLSTAPGGTHALMLSLSGARKLVKSLSHVAFPVDMIMSRPWISGLDLYTVQPGLAVQDLSFESSIGTSRNHKDPVDVTGWPRWIFPITKRWFKITDVIMKRLTYWGAWMRDKNNRSLTR